MTSKTHYIKTDKNTKINDPMIYEILADKDNIGSTVIIDAEENSKSEIIIVYRSEGNEEFEHKAQCTINAKKNSYVRVIKINLMNDNVYFEDLNKSFINDGAECEFSSIDIGAKHSDMKYLGNLQGENAKNKIRSLYIGSSDKKINNDYECIHTGIKSESEIFVKGALAGTSVKKFKGTIDFKRGCAGSKGAEDEYSMLLSDKARSIALPILLCDEEDVSGAHSASSGKIDENKIFYLMTRGLNYNEARKLIVKSQFNEVIDGISDSKLREEIINEIDRRLDDDR